MIATWAILELMGHTRLIGYVTEEDAFGSKIGRIDVLSQDGSQTTQYFGAASVYRLTPTDEATAREMVKPYEYKPLTMSREFDELDDLVEQEPAMASAEEGAKHEQSSNAPKPAWRRNCPNAEYDPFKDEGDGLSDCYSCKPSCDLCKGSAYVADCQGCSGTGYDPFGENDEKCPNCEGRRVVPA